MKNMIDVKPGMVAAIRMVSQPHYAQPNQKRIRQAIVRSGAFQSID